MFWFLHPVPWIQVKLLEFHPVEGETSGIIVNAIVNLVKKFNIEEKTMCFWGDNTNSNFGGAQCCGKHTVLTQLRNLWSRNVLWIGCGAHIIHNCVQTNCNILPMERETLFVKVCKYFLYTQSNCTTKFLWWSWCWIQQNTSACHYALSLINGILEMFEPLKNYFVNQPKCPSVLLNVLVNKSSKFWLHFQKHLEIKWKYSTNRVPKNLILFFTETFHSDSCYNFHSLLYHLLGQARTTCSLQVKCCL